MLQHCLKWWEGCKEESGFPIRQKSLLSVLINLFLEEEGFLSLPLLIALKCAPIKHPEKNGFLIETPSSMDTSFCKSSGKPVLFLPTQPCANTARIAMTVCVIGGE